MLVHGREAVLTLAGRCQVQSRADVNGWHVDLWEMTEPDLDAAVYVYNEVLAGAATPTVLALLDEAGIDLKRYLNDQVGSKDDITRADLTELTAAASLVAAPGCDVDMMQMPNVPKMSRRKSESGFDITVVGLRDDLGEEVELQDGERLIIASVKHSVGRSAGGMRWKLVESLTTELTHPYLSDQLRVLNGQLIREGHTKAFASRISTLCATSPKVKLSSFLRQA